MQYRKEIDGLRALAVLPVILFHAGFDRFSGGYIGVDVFFVISGYLITTIIITEKEQGTFSLIGFYERRCRRIIPALFVVMAVSVFFSWFLLTPEQLIDFSQSLVAVSTFSSNILFWREAGGYWGAVNDLKPLLHTWSLAVEEQFYFLFPLLLMLIWKLPKRWILSSLFAVALASLLLSQWAAFYKPKANFFLLPTRAWELCIGVGIAFYFFYRPAKVQSPFSNKFLGDCLSCIGLGLIAYAVFAFDEHTPFPSFYALIPTLGAALVIIFCSQETRSGKILGSPILVGIGLISYSAYLWHQPIFAFARRISLHEPSLIKFAGLSVLSLLLAYISWRIIEVPFRRSARFSGKNIFLFTIVGSLVFTCVGLTGVMLKGLPLRYPAEFRDTASLTLNEVNADRNRLSDQLCNTKIHDIVCGSIKAGSANILILGDSHAPDGLNIFTEIFPEANFLILQKPGCPLIRNLTGVTYAYQECGSFNKLRFSVIERLSKDIDLAVLSQRMSFPRSEGTRHTIHWVHDKGLPIAVLGAGPQYEQDVVSLVLRHKNFDGLNIKLSESSITDHYGVDDKIAPIVEKLGGYYIRKQAAFCPEGICGGVLPDRSLVMFDNQHLTLAGASWFGKAISKDSEKIKKVMRNNVDKVQKNQH